MTEPEWFECQEPGRLISHVRGRVSGRKLRQIAVASASRTQHLLSGEQCRQALEAARQLAEGNFTEDDTEPIRRELWNYIRANAGTRPPHTANADAAVAKALHPLPDEAARMAAWEAAKALVRGRGIPWERADYDRMTIQRELADLVRCIFGNPFRPVAADPAWRTSTVVGLAAAVYADRAFDRLLILADALEDAGCDHPDVLAHCRTHPEHARGCWVVDLILGKS